MTKIHWSVQDLVHYWNSLSRSTSQTCHELDFDRNLEGFCIPSTCQNHNRQLRFPYLKTLRIIHKTRLIVLWHHCFSVYSTTSTSATSCGNTAWTSPSAITSHVYPITEYTFLKYWFNALTLCVKDSRGQVICRKANNQWWHRCRLVLAWTWAE